MASFRGVTIKDNVITRDESATDNVWFDENTLRGVTAIGDFCFGLDLDTLQKLRDDDRHVFESHHASTGPSVLDLSLLVSCESIGDGFAVGHYGPVMLPPCVAAVGGGLMIGAKCRVLELPSSLASIGPASFCYATANRIVMPSLVSLPDACFRQAHISTLEIPGSVKTIGALFCELAAIGTLTFAESDVNDRDRLFQDAFLEKATVRTLDLQRNIRLVSNGRWVIAASAKISLLRHDLPTWLWNPATEAASSLPGSTSDETDPIPDIRTAFLGNPHNACLFPNSAVTIAENASSAVAPEMSMAPRALQEPEDSNVPEVDLATLEVFEDAHRSLVQDGDTIDMRGLVKCEALGAKCFVGLSAVSTLLLPPNLRKIGANFMEGANVPHLDITFPRSLQQVGVALADATVRSVDFSGCGDLRRLAGFLDRATVKSFTFPPMVESIGQRFMKGINAPKLDLVFPDTVRDIERQVLSDAKLRSVDFSRLTAGKRGRLFPKFDTITTLDTLLMRATVEEIIFPPTIHTIGADFMRGANSPQLDLVFPPSVVHLPRLSEATVRSFDASACSGVKQISDCLPGHLHRATFGSYAFPPNALVIGPGFMSGAVSPNLDLVFPSSLAVVAEDVLQEANIRSVNFSSCGEITSLSSQFLQNATVASVSFPPNIDSLGASALSGVRGENLELEFPASLRNMEDDVLRSADIHSVVMSAAHSCSQIQNGFCSQATIAGSFKMPPAIASLGTGAFSFFTCAQFRFDASPTLERIEADVFRGANIATVAITDCPKLEMIGDSFLVAAALEAPASLVFSDRMNSVGKEFCAETTLERLDMRRCNGLSTLPDNFLHKTDSTGSDTSSEVWSLPPKVNTIGDFCFAMSRGIPSIGDSANRSALVIGDHFGAGSEIERVPWTGRRVTVGHSFCKDVKHLEIADTDCFHSVGDDFCRGVGNLTVDFSPCAVDSVGTGFLQGATFSPETVVDLRRCCFTECPERFMYQARFERGGEVTLPSTVASIGSRCCAETHLEKLTVTSSATLVIKDDFLRDCISLKCAALPATVASFGDGCFQGCPALAMSLHLPVVIRIGNNFCAGNKSTLSGDVPDQEEAPAPVTTLSRTKLSLFSVCPNVQIGDNFLARADCAILEFGSTGTAAVADGTAVRKDTLSAELEAALGKHEVCGLADGAIVLRELITLRKLTVAKMASDIPAFRSVAEELSELESVNDFPDQTERDALLEELRAEEDLIFRHDTTHQHEWARQALQRRDFTELLRVLKEKHRIVEEKIRHQQAKKQDQAAAATSPALSENTIGDNFLADTVGLTKLDMSRALHVAIGDRFAANSALREVHLPPTVVVIGKGVCDGCFATVSAAPQSQSTRDCYLSSWMNIRIEKERIDTLVHFRELLPASERCGMARWLLEQKRFAEFKGAFEIRDDATNLRYVGGTVDDLPEIPSDVPAWFGFDMKVAPADGSLSLLHWAVKYSRQFAHLLSEVSWSLRDLTLVTDQGFTALHYAVLYDIEAAALSTLLSIAAKAEIHRTWSDAWTAGGVRMSPLHLAYLYRRDAIVKELLAFEWDPTEAIKPGGPNDTGTLFDAFDQSVIELGQARAAAAWHGTEDDQVPEDGVRLPVPVQLFNASVLLCVFRTLESGIYHGCTSDQGIHRAFVTLRHQLSTDFPLLSPNKWAEARAQQLALAAWGSGEPDVDGSASLESVDEFLQESFASALSDPVHGPNVRLQHRQVLSTADSLRAFVVAISDPPPIPTYTFVAELGAQVRSRLQRICRSKPSHAAPKITAETLLLRVQSMEEGPHRDKVEDKLAVVIPFRFVIPVLPFFYLMLMIVFGLSWFFHPPILGPTLMGVENAIADCTNPYNTKDATEDGVIPWDCSVGFTELGMQVETFRKQTETTPRMASFFSFIEKENIPRNVTHLPWAYLRFATIVTYNGLKTKASSLTDAETTPEDTAQEYWVLTELRKLPDWAPEIFEQKNTKANESTISFKGETTRTFSHTVVPYQFGNYTLLSAWMAGVAVLLLACIVAFVYHGYAFSTIIVGREVRLVEVSAVQRSMRSVLLACEFAAVLFIAVGLGIMAVTLEQHRGDDIISRPTAAQWHRVEIFFRVGLTFCSFRAVSFFSEMPKPHHFAMVNSGVVAIGLVAALVSLLLLPTSRVGLAASLKSLLSIQAVDALTLPVVLAVSLFLRSSKVTDEVRQAHYDNLREDIEKKTDNDVGALPDRVRRLTVSPDRLPRQGSAVGRSRPSHTAVIFTPNTEEPATFRVGSAVSERSAGSAVGACRDEEVYTEVQPFTAADSNDGGEYLVLDGAAKAQPPAENSIEGEQHDCRTDAEQPPAEPKDGAATVRSRAWRRWILSWAVILVAGLGQVLLYGLAVTVVARPLLTLPAPGGVLPVTGDSFLSSDDLGMVGFARRFFF